MRKIIRTAFLVAAVIVAFRAGSLWQKNIMEAEKLLGSCMHIEVDADAIQTIQEYIPKAADTLLRPVWDRLLEFGTKNADIQACIESFKFEIMERFSSHLE